ncbi:hypothetical protein P154DRAFT_567916 [Amniculicola lignicola CBS 123094]|uniref:Uncharacterized protein n=1 Tax=Amniculicola lignicola CBS 123094 TaxID=1392246 RepID=A0A6A5VXF4_9PLEO|nr:hypothetical protein P154DRAFT_567916 [Amniculicola lignicola CBS 123094]
MFYRTNDVLSATTITTNGTITVIQTLQQHTVELTEVIIDKHRDENVERSILSIPLQQARAHSEELPTLGSSPDAAWADAASIPQNGQISLRMILTAIWKDVLRTLNPGTIPPTIWFQGLFLLNYLHICRYRLRQRIRPFVLFMAFVLNLLSTPLQSLRKIEELLILNFLVLWVPTGFSFSLLTTDESEALSMQFEVNFAASVLLRWVGLPHGLPMSISFWLVTGFIVLLLEMQYLDTTKKGIRARHQRYVAWDGRISFF